MLQNVGDIKFQGRLARISERERGFLFSGLFFCEKKPGTSAKRGGGGLKRNRGSGTLPGWEPLQMAPRKASKIQRMPNN